MYSRIEAIDGVSEPPAEKPPEATPDEAAAHMERLAALFGARPRKRKRKRKRKVP